MPALYDSFDNADSTTLGASWLLATGDWEIVSNKRERNPRPCALCGGPPHHHSSELWTTAPYVPVKRTKPLRAHTRVIRELEAEVARLTEENARLDVIVTRRWYRDLRRKIRLRAMMDIVGFSAVFVLFMVFVWLVSGLFVGDLG